MRPFAAQEIAVFLQAIDRHLKEPFRLEMIGGAVALLCFKSKRGTLDIDAAQAVGKIEDACDAARKETGLKIPLQTAIYEAPYEYESRSVRLSRPKLRKLQIFVPEKHDWALMKVARYNQKDVEDIREVAGTIGFKKEVLFERFLNEMTHVTGDPKVLVLSFLLMMEGLYGKEEADRMEKVIRSDKRWKRA